jgi:hypothetical protein
MLSEIAILFDLLKNAMFTFLYKIFTKKVMQLNVKHDLLTINVPVVYISRSV